MKKIMLLAIIATVFLTSCTKQQDDVNSKAKTQSVFIRIKANNTTGTTTYSNTNREEIR